MLLKTEEFFESLRFRAFNYDFYEQIKSKQDENSLLGNNMNDVVDNNPNESKNQKGVKVC